MSETQPLLAASARRRILEEAISKLPNAATVEETDRAIARVRVELGALGPDTAEDEVLRAALRAVRPVVNECVRRVRCGEWLGRAHSLLPFGADEKDESEAVELASEALQDLPLELPGWQVHEKILKALAPLSKRIKRNRRIRELITHGRGRVAIFLWELFREGAIERKEYLDLDLRHDLEQAIVEELEDELDGSETERDVEQLVESIVEDELDLEVVDDDDD